jgi:hypothetical protein
VKASIVGGLIINLFDDGVIIPLIDFINLATVKGEPIRIRRTKGALVNANMILTTQTAQITLQTEALSHIEVWTTACYDKILIINAAAQDDGVSLFFGETINSARKAYPVNLFTNTGVRQGFGDGVRAGGSAVCRASA